MKKGRTVVRERTSDKWAEAVEFTEEVFAPAVRPCAPRGFVLCFHPSHCNAALTSR